MYQITSKSLNQPITLESFENNQTVRIVTKLSTFISKSNLFDIVYSRIEDTKIFDLPLPIQSMSFDVNLRAKNGHQKGLLNYQNGDAYLSESYKYSEEFIEYLTDVLLASASVTLNISISDGSFALDSFTINCVPYIRVLNIEDLEEDYTGSFVGSEGNFVLLGLELYSASSKESYVVEGCWTPELIEINHKQYAKDFDEFEAQYPWQWIKKLKRIKYQFNGSEDFGRELGLELRSIIDNYFNQDYFCALMDYLEIKEV